MYYDLNISGEAYFRYKKQFDLSFLTLIQQALEEGYSGLAVNFTFDRLLTEKDKNPFEKIDISLLNTLPLEKINAFK